MDEREYHDQFYAQHAADMFYEPVFLESYRRINDFFIKNAVPDGGRVLSLGCGDGHREIALAPQTKHILGVDVSSAAIASARENAARAGVANAEFQVGDIRTMEFPQGSFDAIWAPAILHHIDDGMIEHLARRSRDWLRPGGVFCSVDPSSKRLVSLFKRLFHDKYEKFHSPDERELDPDALMAVFRAAGYRDIGLRYPDFFLNPLAWLFPKLPVPLVKVASMLDGLLVAAPAINAYSSSFGLLAKNPSA